MYQSQCIKVLSSARIILSKNNYMVRKCALASTGTHCLYVRYTTASRQLNTINPLMKNYISKSSSLKATTPPSKLSQAQEDLLEKLVSGLSSDIHQKNRVYKNDLLRVISKVQELNFSTKKQGLLLLRCCAELLPDESSSSRMTLVEQIWNTLKPHTKFTTDHYNELLRIYIANNRTLTVSTFINQMSPNKPTITTYELILRALGEVGDINQATEVIANMKAKEIPATESIFNSLILCQGKAGQGKNIQEVLVMMKSLQIDLSIDTYTAKIRALIWNNQTKHIFQEMDTAERSGLMFEETHIMEIVKTLASMNQYPPISQVLKHLPEETLKKPSISPYMQSVTTSLVFQNHPMAAFEIYKCLSLPSFGPKDDQGLHGRSLVRDCVKASMPSSIIWLITQELMSSGRNPIAIYNAAEAALKLGKAPLAMDLFTRMQQLGMPLRPHYFWPIILHSMKTNGEKGIMNTLSTMNSMNVHPDYETIYEYCLPHVSFTSPQNLMKKFLDAGLSVTMVLTPMMETLLNTGQVRAASEICELFEGKIDVEKLLKPLVKGYIISSDEKSTIFILEDFLIKASYKKKDWSGRLLCLMMQNKKVQEDLSNILSLVKALTSTNIRISTQAAEYCISRVPASCPEDTKNSFQELLSSLTDESLLDDGEMFVQQIIPHPKHMNEGHLKSHLVELEAKGMNTRGVLRKLLQQYCREGNLIAAKEVMQKCHKEGVFLSAGMKAAIFDLHVKLGELELAEYALADLSKTSPNFVLDEYKVIDFATLMVYKGQIERAFQLITEQSKKRHIAGGRGISMNCWRLLDATAAQSHASETRKMLELLVELKYCQPNNTLLGPLVRVHLKNGNIHEAVQEFTRLASKYKKTPLKHELLCTIFHTISDGRGEENYIANEKSHERLNKLAENVLNINKQVHGVTDVQLTLIAALADVGFKKTLRKLILDPTVKIHPDAVLRRCERFADEKKVHALENIAECFRDIRHIDIGEVYDLILDVHQREDAYAQALDLWTRMQEANIPPSKNFITNLCTLLKANNQPIPSEIAVLKEKHKVVNI